MDSLNTKSILSLLTLHPTGITLDNLSQILASPKRKIYPLLIQIIMQGRAKWLGKRKFPGKNQRRIVLLPGWNIPSRELLLWPGLNNLHNCLSENFPLDITSLSKQSDIGRNACSHLLEILINRGYALEAPGTRTHRFFLKIHGSVLPPIPRNRIGKQRVDMVKFLKLNPGSNAKQLYAIGVRPQIISDAIKSGIVQSRKIGNTRLLWNSTDATHLIFSHPCPPIIMQKRQTETQKRKSEILNALKWNSIYDHNLISKEIDHDHIAHLRRDGFLEIHGSIVMGYGLNDPTKLPSSLDALNSLLVDSSFSRSNLYQKRPYLFRRLQREGNI